MASTHGGRGPLRQAVSSGLGPLNMPLRTTKVDGGADVADVDVATLQAGNSNSQLKHTE